MYNNLVYLGGISVKKSDDTKKKYFIIGIAIILIIVIILLLLSSCGKGLEVEFNVDGNVYLTQKLHKGDKLEDVEEPKKKGYTFEGWYLDGEKYPLDQPIEEDITLEAVFSKNKYTVTFGDESGEENSQTIEYGDKLTKPEDPTKEDYAFLGWFVGDTEYDFNEPVTGDLDLTPKWVKNKASYTVEHYLMGLDGKYSDKAYKKEKFKGTIGKTVKPAVKSFKGFTSPSIKVIEGLEDNKLIIKYYYERNKYDVTITGDKGILEVTGSGKYYYGEDVKISAVVKDGYIFKKWSNGTKNLTFTYNVSDNNAKFEALTTVNTYDISYELNGGTLNNKNNNYTVEDEITFEIPSKLGYTFTGWLLDGKEFDGTIKAGTTGDLNVEATFKPNENTKYVIQYYLMDTTGENYILDETRSVNKTGTTDTKIEYTPEDIEGFAKPVLKDQYNQEVDLEDLVIEADESTVLKYYYERNKYDLTIKGDFGVLETVGSGNYYYDSEVEVSATLKDGYSLVKWSNEKTDLSFTYTIGAENSTLEVTTKADDNIPYTVEHYLMDLDGEHYTLKDTDNLIGTTDTIVTPPVKTYEGFTAPNEESVKVVADGSAIVKYYYERNKYDLTINYINTLDENDTEGVESITSSGSHYYGETVTADIELLEGFDFVEWSNKDTNTSTNYVMTATNNQTLTASIKRHTYKVNFNSQRGTKVDSIEVLYGKKITKPTDPTRDGYDFVGWFTESNGNTSWDFEKDIMPSNDITLYAKWNIHRNTVTFEANGGRFADGEGHEDVPRQSVGSQINELEEPTREGYNFAGWYESADGTGEKWDFEKDTMPDNALILHAKWTPITFTIHFEGNTSTSGSMSDLECTYDQDCILTTNGFVKQYTVNYDDNNSVENSTTSKQSDTYHFVNWKNNDKTYTSEFNVKNLTSTDKEIITLNAQWEIDEDTTNLKEVSRTGYTFDAWYNDNTKVDSLSNISSDLDLKANWIANKYTVTYDKNKGNGSTDVNGEVSSTTHTYDNKEEKLSSNEYSRVGYKFLGWSKSNSATQVDYAAGASIDNLATGEENDKNVTLYAVWQANEYTVEFNGNGNTNTSVSMKSITCTFDQDCTLTANTYEKKYTVNYDDNDTTSILRVLNNSQTVKYDFVEWKNGNNSYKDEDTVKNLATGDENNKTVTLNAQWIIDSSTTTLRSVSRTGYRFAGWYNGNNRVDALNDISSDLDLKAHWDVNHYSVTYDSNKGNGSSTPTGSVQSTNHAYDTNNELPSSGYSRKGYTFLGWSKTQHKDSVDADICTDCITTADNLASDDNANVTLYAVWNANKYTIEFKGNTNTSGSMNNLECTYDKDCTLTKNTYIKQYIVNYDYNDTSSTLRILNNSQTVKYDFVKWQNGDKTYDDGATVKNLATGSDNNKTATLTAQWEINEESAKLENATRTGYDFDGWFKGETNETKVDDLTDLNEELKLKAHWTPITYTIVFDGNGGETSDGKTQVEVTATYDKALESIESFTNSLTLTYDYDSGQVSKKENNLATFVDWKFNDLTYSDPSDIVNLTSNKGDKITLKAEWTYPVVTIEENDETKIKEPDDIYYEYELKDWTDGSNDYQLNSSLTLTDDVTLNAEYLKVIDTDKYVQEKMITSSRTDDLTTASDKSNDNAYNIDIVNVNGDIVNSSDVTKIEAILKDSDGKNEDVLNVTLSSDNKNVVINANDNIQGKIDDLLSQIIVNTTSATVEKDKHLSSLYGKTISFTVNFDEEFAKTTDETSPNSATYDLTYINTNKHIITQEMLYDFSKKGLDQVNSSNNHHFKATRNLNTISARVNPKNDNINVMCIFAKEKLTVNFCDTNDSEKSYTLSGGTGMNNAVSAFFKSESIGSVSIFDINNSYLETLTRDTAEKMGASDTTELANFASNVVDALGVTSDYKPNGFMEQLAQLAYPKLLALKGVYPNMLVGKSFYVEVNLADGYVYADGVNNKYKIEIISPLPTDTW